MSQALTLALALYMLFSSPSLLLEQSTSRHEPRRRDYWASTEIVRASWEPCRRWWRCHAAEPRRQRRWPAASRGSSASIGPARSRRELTASVSAAAFCLHENTSTPSTLRHLGHAKLAVINDFSSYHGLPVSKGMRQLILSSNTVLIGGCRLKQLAYAGQSVQCL